MSAPVQTVFAEDPNTGSFGTTIAVTLTGLHAGAPIWVGAGHDGNANDVTTTTITVADTLNGAWPTPLLTAVEVDFAHCTYTFGLASSAAGTATITVSWPGAGSVVGKWIVASEMPVGSYLDHTSFLDQDPPTAGVADAATTGTIANAHQPGLVIALCFAGSDRTALGPAAGTAFTSLGTTSQCGAAFPKVRVETASVSTLGVEATFTRPVGADAEDLDYVAHGAVYVDGGNTVAATASTDTPDVTDSLTKTASFGRVLGPQVRTF